jgi:LPXTG-site transpeptidase (sortase) family protein
MHSASRNFAEFIGGVGRGMVIASLGLAAGMAVFYSMPGLTSQVMRSLADMFNPYAQFEPDEFIFDYTLGADVPRLYYVSIPKLGLYAPVVGVYQQPTVIDGSPVSQLHVPNAFAAGWDAGSAPIGRAGNTVLVGHNNEYGEVFKNLWNLVAGDEIIVHTASGDRSYVITNTIMFQELGRPLVERRQNAQWLSATNDERITLVTCWPYYSNTHRFIVVAVPAGN